MAKSDTILKQLLVLVPRYSCVRQVLQIGFAHVVATK